MCVRVDPNFGRLVGAIRTQENCTETTMLARTRLATTTTASATTTTAVTTTTSDDDNDEDDDDNGDDDDYDNDDDGDYRSARVLRGWANQKYLILLTRPCPQETPKEMCAEKEENKTANAKHVLGHWNSVRQWQLFSILISDYIFRKEWLRQ